MKTKNNVQKTVLRTAAVVVSFVLISFTVTAQEFWRTVLTKSSFNQIALAMVETSKKANTSAPGAETSSKAVIYEKDYDEKLNVEDWMTDNNFYNSAKIQQVEKEKTLKVENWMIDESLFALVNETESPLILESWMVNSEIWEKK